MGLWSVLYNRISLTSFWVFVASCPSHYQLLKQQTSFFPACLYIKKARTPFFFLSSFHYIQRFFFKFFVSSLFFWCRDEHFLSDLSKSAAPDVRDKKPWERLRWFLTKLKVLTAKKVPFRMVIAISLFVSVALTILFQFYLNLLILST